MSEWYTPDENLPSDCTFVIAYLTDRRLVSGYFSTAYCDIFFWYESEKWEEDRRKETSLSNVVAWRYLPDPPDSILEVSE